MKKNARCKRDEYITILIYYIYMHKEKFYTARARKESRSRMMLCAYVYIGSSMPSCDAFPVIIVVYNLS